ncbi:MAG: hypothetical protein RL595_912 [Planctomycetota bacterium]|jgi:predicted metallopeptidase
MRHYHTTLSWESAGKPVPQVSFGTKKHILPNKVGYQAPPWIETGPTVVPFDFSKSMLDLIVDISNVSPHFYHLDPQKILVTIIRARNQQRHGLQARVTPMRFEGGNLQCRRRNRLYEVQRYFVDGREIFYIVTFCLPRFQNQSLEGKLVTVFHELFHISPFFDGDLRRHPGRCSWHSSDKKEYDAQMLVFAREYLATTQNPKLHDFLRLDFSQLIARHQGLNGLFVPVPRLLPLRQPAQILPAED